VRALLNRLSGTSNLPFDPEAASGFGARPSICDFMAFVFQPQNVVANPDVQFFKADTNEHREKLKNIFRATNAADGGSDRRIRLERGLIYSTACRIHAWWPRLGRLGKSFSGLARSSKASAADPISRPT
jgi:hypothetical protein